MPPTRKAALLFHWKSLNRQVRVRGPVERVDGGGGRRLFRHPPEAGADRRLGEQAVAPLESRLAFEKAVALLRRKYRARHGAAPAALVRLSHRAADRSSSGTTGRSACTTASNSAARGRREPWTKTRLYP